MGGRKNKMFCLGTGLLRHSAGGVCTFIVHTYICGAYCSQCICTSNGSSELPSLLQYIPV